MQTINRQPFSEPARRAMTLMGAFLQLGGLLAQPSTNVASNPGVPWPATDALERQLPLAREVGLPQPGRFVGMFYFVWHQPHQAIRAESSGPYDIARIVAADPQALTKPRSPLWGAIGTYHYWGEPLYGYYLTQDPWVLRRHAQLLADAGIDTLIIDITNAETYPDEIQELGRIFREIRAAGGRTPQIAFMVNTKAGETADKIYRELYKPGLYGELWFRWDGKPLLLCDPKEASPTIREFFTLRGAHWPFALTNTCQAWHWEATYPQPYGYTEDPGQAEEITVSVAQNLRQSDGKVTNMSAGNARGRSFHDGAEDKATGAVNHGYNFQEQWARALDLRPPFVLVTGWNEWIAGRWGDPNGPLVFVDQFDQEFSRDIEPVKGAHGDNYYYQLVSNVRRFKGMPSLSKSSPPTTMRLSDGFGPWREVRPEFLDAVGETLPRDKAGAAGLHYSNATGRNDLCSLKVAHDADNIYFYARTSAPLSPPQGSNWMWLLIDIDQKRNTGWEGYDFIVNRTREPGGQAWLEQSYGRWEWTKVAPVESLAAGNELVLVVPRMALGLAAGQTTLTVDFKWADNLQHPGDIMDFYVSGDVAPEGRFNFRYTGD